MNKKITQKPVERGVPLTTGQVAKLMFVAPRTVSKWFDNGILKGHRIPGSNDRRIPPANLVDFCTQFGLPVPSELRSDVMASFGVDGPPAIRNYESLVDYGIMLATERLSLSVIGDELGLSTLAEAVRATRSLHPNCRIVLVVGDDVTDGQLADMGLGGYEVFRRPFDWSRVGLPL